MPSHILVMQLNPSMGPSRLPVLDGASVLLLREAASRRAPATRIARDRCMAALRAGAALGDRA